MKNVVTPQVVPSTSSRGAAGWSGWLLAAVLMSGCHPAGKDEPKLDSDVAKASYWLGYNIAGNANNQWGGALDAKAFTAGAADRFANAQAKVAEPAALAALNALNDASEKARGELAKKNLAASKAYLAENAKKPGVVALPSGLQYEVLKQGDGPKPGPDDTVTTHYTGTLIDGSVFDSSEARGVPASFQVGQVIPGWQEALQLMPVGSKWRLVIPPSLAYGERGAGGKIGPNEALIFTVELLSIEPSGSQDQTPQGQTSSG
jgi:FKBP-type peptidyl-prolyl cis-trans isomerase FklB